LQNNSEVTFEEAVMYLSVFCCPKGSIQSVFCHSPSSCSLLSLQLLKQKNLLILMVTD